MSKQFENPGSPVGLSKADIKRIQEERQQKLNEQTQTLLANINSNDPPKGKNPPEQPEDKKEESHSNENNKDESNNNGTSGINDKQDQPPNENINQQIEVQVENKPRILRIKFKPKKKDIGFDIKAIDIGANVIANSLDAKLGTTIRFSDECKFGLAWIDSYFSGYKIKTTRYSGIELGLNAFRLFCIQHHREIETIIEKIKKRSRYSSVDIDYAIRELIDEIMQKEINSH